MPKRVLAASASLAVAALTVPLVMALVAPAGGVVTRLAAVEQAGDVSSVHYVLHDLRCGTAGTGLTLTAVFNERTIENPGGDTQTVTGSVLVSAGNGRQRRIAEHYTDNVGQLGAIEASGVSVLRVGQMHTPLLVVNGFAEVAFNSTGGQLQQISGQVTDVCTALGAS